MELMVALVLSFIVLTLCFFVFSSMQKQYRHWQEKEKVFRIVYTINRQLNKDVMSIKRIQLLSPTEMIFIKTDDKVVRYVFVDSLLFRNNMRLNSILCPIKNFRFLCYLDENQKKMLEFIYPIKNKPGLKWPLTENAANHIKAVQYNFQLYYKGKKYNYSSLINLRNKWFGL